MSTVIVQAEIDNKLKVNAEQYLNSWGLDVSTAIKIFLAKVVETRSIPFIIGSNESDGFYDNANIEWLKQSHRQAKEGNFVFKTTEELDKMAL